MRLLKRDELEDRARWYFITEEGILIWEWGNSQTLCARTGAWRSLAVNTPGTVASKVQKSPGTVAQRWLWLLHTTSRKMANMKEQKATLRILILEVSIPLPSVELVTANHASALLGLVQGNSLSRAALYLPRLACNFICNITRLAAWTCCAQLFWARPSHHQTSYQSREGFSTVDAGGDLIPRQAAKGLTKAIGSFKSFLLVSREQKFVALSRVSSKLITVKLLSLSVCLSWTTDATLVSTWKPVRSRNKSLIWKYSTQELLCFLFIFLVLLSRSVWLLSNLKA